MYIQVAVSLCATPNIYIYMNAIESHGLWEDAEERLVLLHVTFYAVKVSNPSMWVNCEDGFHSLREHQVCVF
jgi:hypothetical protein